MQVGKLKFLPFHFLRKKVKVKLSMQEELDMSRLQVKQLNDLVSEADEIVKVSKQFIRKEREKVDLQNILFETHFLPGQRERGCPAYRVN